MSQRETITHLIAGGAGGTAGAIATCPLEVVKTRLQSTVATFNHHNHHNHLLHHHHQHQQHHHHHAFVSSVVERTSASHQHQPLVHLSACAESSCRSPDVMLIAARSTSASASASVSATAEMQAASSSSPTVRFGILKCIKYIVANEGSSALFKGLGPNLIGVAPSRAIYFSTYSQAKIFFNKGLTPDTPVVHMCSAVCAGFASCTATNPIWFVKTRLQLDQNTHRSKLTAVQCVRDIFRKKGLTGFYKGITASYFGISETVIHLVIYEAVKAKLRQLRECDGLGQKSSRDFVEYMFAGAFSKTCASCIAYPHEVARTRLREEGNKYHRFWQTLGKVAREEGHRGLYRGLATQLVRQIPNTAIMMSTYELVVYMLSNTMMPRMSNDDDSMTT